MRIGRQQPEGHASRPPSQTIAPTQGEVIMKLWTMIGFLGQAVFAMRFIVQWIASERKGQSIVPVIFWYFSLGGGLTLLLYAIHIKDPVFILGQSLGSVIYMRNLVLIYRKDAQAITKNHEQS
jgi:lipid-A-disaccharide synthase-like uncharacterized protein